MSDTLGEEAYTCQNHKSNFECIAKEDSEVIPIDMNWIASTVSKYPKQIEIASDLIKIELLLEKNFLKKKKRNLK